MRPNSKTRLAESTRKWRGDLGSYLVAYAAANPRLFVVGFVMKRDLKLLISQWRTYATLGIILRVFFVSIVAAEKYIEASLARSGTSVLI